MVFKAVEKEVRNEVQDSLTAANAGKPLADSELTKEIYSTADFKDEPQTYNHSGGILLPLAVQRGCVYGGIE